MVVCAGVSDREKYHTPIDGVGLCACGKQWHMQTADSMQYLYLLFTTFLRTMNDLIKNKLEAIREDRSQKLICYLSRDTKRESQLKRANCFALKQCKHIYIWTNVNDDEFYCNSCG